MSKRTGKGLHVKYRPDRELWEVVEYINNKRKRHATGFSSREDAEEKLAEIIIERKAPQKNVIEITLGEIMAYYIKEHVNTLPRPHTVIRCLERIIPVWGDLRLEDIRKSKVFEYIDYRRDEFNKWQIDHGYKKIKTLKDQSVRRELEQLQAAINYAYKDNLILVCPYVWKPEKSKPRERWLTQKEAAKLLREAKRLPKAGEYLWLFIILGLYTGARSEAISKLRWSQIDFERNFINFKVNQISINKRASRVPMPRRLARELKREFEIAQSYGAPNSYVVHRDAKRVKSVKNSFKTACQLAKLEAVTPHTLRHTAASWLVQKNISFAKIGEYIGMSPQMVEQVYGHLAPEHLQEAIDAYG